jgi:hypothetical protein
LVPLLQPAVVEVAAASQTLFHLAFLAVQAVEVDVVVSVLRVAKVFLAKAIVGVSVGMRPVITVVAVAAALDQLVEMERHFKVVQAAWVLLLLLVEQ